MYGNSPLTLFSQKFRESNGFTKEKFLDAGIQDISTRIKISVKVHNEIRWSDMNLEIVRWVNDFRWVKGV